MPHRLSRYISDAWRLKDRRSIWEWARDNVTLFPPLTRTGKFDISTSRHFELPLEWLGSDSVAEVSVVAPVRSGKTLIADVWLDHTVCRDPGPFRVVMQDDQIAREHAESRTIRQLKSIPGMELILPDDRHKDRGQEIIFPSGHSLYIQGPAVNKLQSKGFRYIWVDEPWLPNILKNFSEIRGRLGDYEKMKISKLLCTGQGGEGGDAWDAHAHSGEWNDWHVQCEKCGHYMPAKFSAERQDGTRWGVVWDDHRDANEYWDISKCLPTVRFECEACGHAHLDTGRTKEEWNRTGKYVVVGNENRTKKACHWTAVIDYPWANLVDQWLQARNVWRQTREPRPTIVFWQKRMAEFRNEKTVQGDDTLFRREIYDTTEKAQGEVARIMTIDCQSETVFWVLVRAWIVDGPKVESRRIWFGKLFSYSDIDAKSKELKVTIRPLIDSGYNAKGSQGIYAAAIKFKWIATKGVGGVLSFTHWVNRRRVMRCYAERTKGDSNTPLGNCNLYRYSTDAMNDMLEGLINSGAWVEPKVNDREPIEEDYRRQMRSEVLAPKRLPNGRIAMKWETIDRENHARDLSKMQAIAAVIAKVLPDPFSEKRNENETTNDKDTAPSASR